MTEETVFENNHGEIWRCGRFYMIYLKNPSLNVRVAAWKDSLLTATYFYSNGGVYKQYRIPLKKLKNAIKVLKEAEEKERRNTGT